MNLRRILQQKRTSVPAKIRSRLENLLVKNDELSNYFQSMVQKYQNVTKMAQEIQRKVFFCFSSYEISFVCLDVCFAVVFVKYLEF